MSRRSFKFTALNIAGRPVLELILQQVGRPDAFHSLVLKAPGVAHEGGRPLPDLLSIPRDVNSTSGRIVQSTMHEASVHLRYEFRGSHDLLRLQPLASQPPDAATTLQATLHNDLVRFGQQKSSVKAATQSRIFCDDRPFLSAAFPQLGSPPSQTPVLARIAPALSLTSHAYGNIDYGGGRAFDHASTPAFSSPRIGPAPPRPQQPVHAPMARGLVNLGNTVSGDYAQWKGALATGGST